MRYRYAVELIDGNTRVIVEHRRKADTVSHAEGFVWSRERSRPRRALLLRITPRLPEWSAYREVRS